MDSYGSELGLYGPTACVCVALKPYYNTVIDDDKRYFRARLLKDKMTVFFATVVTGFRALFNFKVDLISVF